jgi:carboxyl-terminal processing protease
MPNVTRLLVLALLVAACSTPATVQTTTTPEITRPLATTATTAPALEVSISGCETPPVTFSPLCEIYDLLESWYVDSPVDPTLLAEVALRGLEEFETTETEEPPRTLFCAIPHQAFSSLCDGIATRVEQSQIPVGKAVEAAMSYMIDFGLDPFTYYLPPDQAGAVRLNGIVGGIGVLLDARDAAGSKCTEVSTTCRLEVVIVFEDNPAFEAGLAAGDVITTVDGMPVEGKGFAAVVSLIAGDETGAVDIVVERNGTPVDFSIERADLSFPTVELGLPLDEVGYIRIPDFELDVPALVTEALVEISTTGPDTIVVDLRDNPGGYVDAYLDIVDEFIDGGVVMVTESSYEYFEYGTEPGGAAIDPRLLVLVNQGTASAGEVLAASLREIRGAVLVGTNTFGKDAVQIPFTLRNGGEFYVAVARWSTPDGDTAANGGLTPDHVVSWPAGATIEEVVDIALEASS